MKSPSVRIESGKFKGKRLLLPSFATTRSTKSRVRACVFNTLRGELKDKIFVEVFGGSGAMAFEALSNDALGVVIIEKDEKAYKIACENARWLLGSENSGIYDKAGLNFRSNSRNSTLNAVNFSRDLETCENVGLNFNGNSSSSNLQSLNFSENSGNFAVFGAKNVRVFNASFVRERVLIFNADSFELLPTLLKDEKFSQNVIAYFDPPFHLRNGFGDIYERVFDLINSLQGLNQGLNLQAFIIEHSSQIPTPATLGAFTRHKFKKFGNTSLSFYMRNTENGTRITEIHTKNA